MSVPADRHPCARCGVTLIRGPLGGVCSPCWDEGPGDDPLRVAIARALRDQPNGPRAKVAADAARHHFTEGNG